jgi:hypothetical protein
MSQNIKEKLDERRMHGEFTHSLNEKLVDKEQSYRWLKFGDINGETVSKIVAAQYKLI